MFLMAVMVCLAITMALIVSWLKLATVEQRAARERQLSLQANWLAESALERAAGRLAANSNYTGETWSLSPVEIGGAAAGEVAIQVKPVAGRPRVRQVHVQADYPATGDHRHRRSKDLLVEIPSRSEASP
jgi:type II secretory pathway pseudopilin PulG